jgi:type II secretory pathway pseudopilin PulG
MKKNTGLTLVEVLIVTSLLVILLALGTVIFANFARQDEIAGESQKIVALVNEARAKTLAGYSGGGESGLNFGVHFEADAYTLFSGVSFNSADPSNQKFDLPVRLRITDLSLASGNIIFEKITGEVRDFDPAQNFIVLADQRAGQEKKIIINKLGVMTIE